VSQIGKAGADGRWSLSEEEVAFTPDRVRAVVALEGAEQISCIIAVAPDSIESIVHRAWKQEAEKQDAKRQEAAEQSLRRKKPRQKRIDTYIE